MNTASRRMNDRTATTTVRRDQGQQQTTAKSLEKQIFRLKLQWVMARDDNEKKRVSEDIRRLISPTTSK